MVGKKGSKKVVSLKKGSSKRELIDTGTDKRYVRRDEKGRFAESDDVGRSLSQDVKNKAKTKVPAGQGDRGDQKRSKGGFGTDSTGPGYKKK
ncbi:MAG TPA: hypothetical protein VGN95_14630 [Pyrinomonadaceae bacterium]|jgi:hypothetical protein|nr:hypothetical protein [Pyrinomonadaceae bacterium]